MGEREEEKSSGQMIRAMCEMYWLSPIERTKNYKAKIVFPVVLCVVWTKILEMMYE